MATLAQVKSGLKTRLLTIPALGGQVYDYLPGTQEPPAIVIVPGTFIPGDTKAAITYNRTFGNSTPSDYVFTLQVVVSKTVDQVGIAQLDDLLAPVGANSIKGAIEADDTLGAVASYCHVDRVTQYGVVKWNALDYFGAQVICEVCA